MLYGVWVFDGRNHLMTVPENFRVYFVIEPLLRTLNSRNKKYSVTYRIWSSVIYCEMVFIHLMCLDRLLLTCNLTGVSGSKGP